MAESTQLTQGTLETTSPKIQSARSRDLQNQEIPPPGEQKGDRVVERDPALSPFTLHQALEPRFTDLQSSKDYEKPSSSTTWS